MTTPSEEGARVYELMRADLMCPEPDPGICAAWEMQGMSTTSRYLCVCVVVVGSLSIFSHSFRTGSPSSTETFQLSGMEGKFQSSLTPTSELS